MHVAVLYFSWRRWEGSIRSFLDKRFTPLSNSEILFYKVAVRSNTVIFKPTLHLNVAQVSYLCSQCHFIPPITLF